MVFASEIPEDIQKAIDFFDNSNLSLKKVAEHLGVNEYSLRHYKYKKPSSRVQKGGQLNTINIKKTIPDAQPEQQIPTPLYETKKDKEARIFAEQQLSTLSQKTQSPTPQQTEVNNKKKKFNLNAKPILEKGMDGGNAVNLDNYWN